MEGEREIEWDVQFKKEIAEYIDKNKFEREEWEMREKRSE